MTDLEQRIREAYDAQHASEALRGRTLALLEEERKRRPDAPSVEVHRASLRRRPRVRVVTAWAACLLLALPSSVPMACIVRRLLSWTLR